MVGTIQKGLEVSLDKYVAKFSHLLGTGVS